MMESAEIVSNPAVECMRCGKLFGPHQIFHLPEDPRRPYIRCQHCGAKNEIRAEDRFCIRLIGVIAEPTPSRPGA
jgi:DNA-directed RNA polymerase subunit RPC12/RpoP